MSMPKDEIWWLNYNQYEDLRVYEMGIQRCNSGYEFGPIIRDRYILHFVFEGEGVLHLDQKEFKVKKGEFFLLPPNTLVHYQADKKNPWHYSWVQFHGFKATEILREMGLSRKNPIYTAKEKENEFLEKWKDVIANHSKEYLCIGSMYHLFDCMIDHAEKKEKTSQVSEPALIYVRSAVDYINLKFCETISVSIIAEHCGVDRSYLSKIFKHATGLTLQEYLIQFRVKKAMQLLKESDLSVQHVSYSVGYNDPFTFSKVFKKQTGVSPSEWRKEQVDNNKY